MGQDFMWIKDYGLFTKSLTIFKWFYWFCRL